MSRAPDALSLPGPGGTRFAEIRWFAEIDSTNSYLSSEASAGAPEGVVVVADHQRAGRGRLGRTWLAPAGANLLFSVLLRPELAPAELHLCTGVVALSTVAACQRVAGVAPEVKWPNDLMIEGEKLAGILAEVAPGPAGRASVVVGVGLNVNWPEPGGSQGVSVPRDPGATGATGFAATSLWRASGARHDRRDLLEAILLDLDRRVADLGSARGRRVQEADLRRSCSTLGRTVRIWLGDTPVDGMARDLTSEGHLVVDTVNGPVIVSAGDVEHLRELA